VQHGDAPGSGTGKARRPRKVAALGSAGDQARKLLELGDALADAVRAARAGDALAEGLCRRVHELWSGQRAQVLEWHPTELRASGKLVLAASTDSARFVLPAFSAGLRALAMRQQCTTADVLRLAQHLAALENCELDPQGFAGWLWRGGALGFDAAQHESVFEIGEGMIGELDEGALWAERSRQAVDVWNDLAWKSAQAFDARAIAERFRAPLERLQTRLRAGELALHDEEIRALRELADDERPFDKAEIDLILAHPALRTTLSNAHVTWRLASLIETCADLPVLLELFARLEIAPEGRAPSALEPRILGEAFGRRLLGRGLALQALPPIVAQVGPELLSGMLGHLVESEQCGDRVEALLTMLLGQSGLRGVLAHAEVARMQPAFAAALMRAALASGLPSSALASVLQRLPPRSLLATLSALPTLLRAADPALHGLIADRPGEAEALLPEFLRAAPAAAPAVGRGLLRVQGAGFSSDGLSPILSAFVQLGLGRDLVLPLWESRTAPTGVRLAALLVLEHERELLAEAMRRRGASGFDPPEIRIAVEELRWRQP
jgi:hypothetical protein